MKGRNNLCMIFYEWNIDGLSDYLIMNVVNEMMMAAGAYKLQRHKSDHQIAQVLVTGFTGQLKDWWDKYLDETTRQQILNHYVIRPTTQIIKEEGPSTRTEVQHERVEDAVNTLIYTLIEFFVGDPLKYQERSAEILMNLKCPTLGDFRWYKDMYFSKVLIRTDSSLEFWKENFVNGLPKHFSRRIKDGLKTKKELGRFCDQYGCKGIEAPSTSRRKKVKTHPKPYHSYRPRETYRSKPVQSQKPTYSRRKYIPTKTHRGKKKQTCFKCREEGHYANKCPIRGKINELDIDQELKNQLLRLTLTDSEQSSKGEILKLQEESDYILAQNTNQNKKEKGRAKDA
ncbi:uncharacterized protein LOC111440658 [Cucurbita moschata]|uniref:Uncharacterized protein LOC111440658 n=1 Tax=Cucurbita moschata TaxID=3662 RepID=A0A6J1EZI3_CUCMO|nr:uncharacterized protein LOC111440658 [Cucurbita moschata]